MLSEVPLVGHSQLKLLFLNLVLLSAKDALNANEVVIIFENIVTFGRIFNLTPRLIAHHIISFHHTLIRLLVFCVRFIGHFLGFRFLFYKLLKLWSDYSIYSNI